MDDEARLRLKVAVTRSGKSAKAICEEHSWPLNYVSRVLSGETENPAADRLLLICQSVDVDMSYILTGEIFSERKKKLLEDIAKSPQDVINEIAEFMKAKKG